MKYSGTAMFIPVIFFTLFFEKVFYDIMRYRFYIASEKLLKIREKLEDKKDVRINWYVFCLYFSNRFCNWYFFLFEKNYHISANEIWI